MKNKFIIALVKLIVALGVVIALLIPLFNNINYGLDLKGGFEVLYQVSPIGKGKLTSDMLTSTYKTIQRRIDVLGVSEPEIIVEGNDKIRVRLAGVTDQETAREILSKTASLTFRDSSDNLLMTSSILKNAAYEVDQKTGKSEVALSIKDNDKFYEVTKKISESSDKLIVIWLDYQDGVDSYVKEKDSCGATGTSHCLSAATVAQGFAGNVVIEGSFTQQEATNLADLINSGSIPTKLTEISSKTVGASFGQNSLNKTLIAGVIGIALVMLIMISAYRFAGFISAVGIIFYTFLTFVIFYSIGGVLTLPGIAALVLGIGMAVDANVLNFEAIKEELAEGKSLKSAFTKAYKRSFLTIFDANVTTLIVAIILFALGESSVKGFATMLIINIAVTMIVMVFFARFILKMFIDTNYFDNNPNKFIKMRKAVSNIKDNKKSKGFDFLKNRKLFLGGSFIVIVLGLVLSTTVGFNLGIDYKGGSEITVAASSNISVSEIRKDINTFGYKIDDINSINSDTVYVKIDDVLSKSQTNDTTKYFKDHYNAKTEIGVVSDIVKKELTRNAIYSVLLSLIGIGIYVSLRFKFSFAVAAAVAMLHDALIVVAFFAIFRFEVNAIFIAAILTIIGYSLMDTIVIFDRIRENIKLVCKGNLKNDTELYDIINVSLRQTMRRTVYTLSTVLVVVITLMLFGAYEIFNFNLALFIGLISGTYSSLFIASPICYEMDRRNIGKEPKNKKEEKELDEVMVKGINY